MSHGERDHWSGIAPELREALRRRRGGVDLTPTDVALIAAHDRDQVLKVERAQAASLAVALPAESHAKDALLPEVSSDALRSNRAESPQKDRSDDGWLTVVAFVLSVFVAPDLLNLRGILSARPSLWLLLLPALGFASVSALRLYHYTDTLIEARNERRRLSAPCEHGVEAAKLAPSQCRECSKVAEQRRRDEDRRRAADNRREEAEKRERLAQRQKLYGEWISKVRMPEYLRSMDPREFELLACDLFARMGYKVEQTPYTGDGGVDGYLRRDDELIVMQCKRYQDTVGEPVLRELLGTMVVKRATHGWLVTTGTVSRQGRTLARSHPQIRIIELNELTELVRRYFTESVVVPDDFRVASRAPIMDRTCPRCGRSLVRRKGIRGRFLGCHGFPECRFTRPIPR
jgi:restriction system protein